jgi:membrane protein implicated in regulation of membrane protease activity
MSGSLTLWIVLSLFCIFLELLTRTFTLAALAIGFGCAALLGWLGFGFVIELLAAVLVGGGALLWLRRSPAGQALQEAEESMQSVISDDGDEVYISKWAPDNEVEVVFKGRTWNARLARGSKARAGAYKVHEVYEGKLILKEKDR